MSQRGCDFDLEVAELLVVCGFLKPYELDKAHAYKRQSGTTIDESLIKNNLVEKHIVDGARCTLNAIKQNRLPESQARTALYMIANTGISFDEALGKLGLQTSANPWLSSLRNLEDKF